jgi:Uma2 family endonuclease
MAMPEVKRRWTVAERDQLPDDGNRYEVIDGELFVTPAPAWRHQAAVLELAKLLDSYVGQHGIGVVLPAPADVVFGDDRGVQPDLFVVPLVDGRRPEHFDEVRQLLLAVEVLSPSTARADRVRKRRLYREEGVPDYWIVDLDARTFERTTPADDRLEIVTERLVWKPAGASEALTIDIPAYFEVVLQSP